MTQNGGASTPRASSGRGREPLARAPGAPTPPASPTLAGRWAVAGPSVSRARGGGGGAGGNAQRGTRLTVGDPPAGCVFHGRGEPAWLSHGWRVLRPAGLAVGTYAPVGGYSAAAKLLRCVVVRLLSADCMLLLPLACFYCATPTCPNAKGKELCKGCGSASCMRSLARCTYRRSSSSRPPLSATTRRITAFSLVWWSGVALTDGHSF